MSKRQIIKMVLDGKRPPYIPWNCGFTQEPRLRLSEYLNTDDIDTAIDNHFVKLGNSTGFFTDLGNDRKKDLFGVTWNRSIEKDIGVVEGVVLPEPTLKNYTFPDPENQIIFADIHKKLHKYSDCFRVFCIGFSLFERAWTLRGMENLLMDFYINSDFVYQLLDAICDYNIVQVKKALQYDIDAVYFGDDWGHQNGLIIGPRLWKKFIYPRIKRMYKITRDAGKYQFIHSCGDVHELFDDLIEIGVNCFNPFQPEVMDVKSLIPSYRGQLTFHGGLSTQRTLAYGTPEDVRAETQILLGLGAQGSYIFAPSHAVEKDTSFENIFAFLETIKNQPGYR